MAAFTFKDQAFLASAKSSFSPASFPNLELWLKADSFVGVPDGTEIGGPGFEWIDQSGNGRDGVDQGVPTGPAFETNEVGSLPILRFDTLAEALIFSPQLSFAGDFTVMIVNATVAAQWTLWLGHSTDNHQIGRNTVGVNRANYFDGVTFLNSDIFGGASGNLHVLTVRRSGNTVSFRENKTARGTGLATDTIRLDTICNNSFLGSGRGDLAEMFAYSSHRSDSEVDQLYDNYLKTKWITLP